VLHWASEGGSRAGQIYATGLAVGSRLRPEPVGSKSSLGRPSAASADPTPESLASAVQLSLSCDDALALRGASPCLLPVTLHLRNSSDTHLAFDFSATTAIDAAGGGIDAWLGTTRLARRWLPPRGHAQLRLHAAFSASGTFALRGIGVAVCGWRDAGGNAQWLEQPAACPGPAARRVTVTAA